MWLLLATALVAAVVVLITRGSWRALTNLRVTAVWLLGAGLVIQIVLEYVDLPRDQIETVGYGLLMISYGFLLAFCLVNTRTRGFWVIAAGMALNALVIGLNQGMPTRPVGTDAQGNRVRKAVVQTVKHRQERGDDLLGFLGDKILLPRPFDELVSAGDLVIAAGICELAFVGSRKRDKSGVREEASQSG